MRSTAILLSAFVGSCAGSETGAVDAQVADLTPGCVPSGVEPAEAKRTTEANSVSADATLVNALAHCPKETLVFNVILDTHSTDLLGIDVAAIARAELDTGTSITTGFSWTGTSESSHHREGRLEVAAPSLEGATLLTLVLADIAGTERVFEWDQTYLVHDVP